MAATSARQAAIDEAKSLGPAMGRLAELSRRDPAVFAQFVMRDEQTGWPIRLAPMHEEWHELMTAHDRLVLYSAAEMGKSSNVSIARPLWEIGENPSIRILILCRSSGQAKKLVKAAKNYIENSVEYRMCFPHVQPDRSDTTGKWTEDAIIVRRPTISKDPTIQAAGYGSQSVHGGRFDLIIVDDYLDSENTATDRQRLKYYNWLKNTIESRKTARGRLWFVGNVWDADDAMHRYAQEPGVVARKYPVRLDDGTLLWPEVWPHERIEKEIVNRGPIESLRSLFCKEVTDADRRFKPEYIVRALQVGDGREMPYALHMVPRGYRTITGVDLAVSKKDSADESAFVTISVDGRPRIGTGEREILDVEGDRYDGPEIVTRIIDIHHRYNSIIFVESVAAQLYIKQFLHAQSAVPVKAFYTGKNKRDPAFGLLSLVTEMSAGKWAFPNRGGRSLGLNAGIHPEVKKLINEMLRYDPQSHTGDRLIATWIAREGARLTMKPAGTGKRPRPR